MKGICFIEPLHNKVVERLKNQTRRIITPQPDFFDDELPYCETDFRIKSKSHTNEDGEHFFEVKSKYKVGEIVYLKEPYVVSKGGRVFRKYDKSDVSFLRYLGEDTEAKGVWKNKLFMPESAARYFIKITGVRAERLQDISEEDCLKEGIVYKPIQSLSWKDKLTPMWSNGINRYKAPQEAYAALINSINGKGTWEKNPFVWVYDFELINK